MAKILLVEDNEMIRDMLSERLARKGYEVQVAADGAQALALARAGVALPTGAYDPSFTTEGVAATPELILMDMSLPVIDGWQAARELKGAAATRSIPIIALTAHAIAGDREKTLAAGCDDYATKPVDFPQLLVKIQNLLNEGAAI